MRKRPAARHRIENCLVHSAQRFEKRHLEWSFELQKGHVRVLILINVGQRLSEAVRENQKITEPPARTSLDSSFQLAGLSTRYMS